MNKSCLEKLRYCLAIILFFCFSISARAQGYNTTTWKYANPKPFGFQINDIDFFDNNNGIAVGNDGAIAKTTDGGTTWTYGVFTYTMPTGFLSKTTFLDVHYITATTAYAVGTGNVNSGSVFGGGVMAKTTDGGLTWNMIVTPLYANRRNINTVWFLNRDTGYIAGSWNTSDSIPKLYFTRNGGSTWDSIAAPVGGKTKVGYVNNPNVPSSDWDINSKGKEIQRIEFLNDSVGFVLGGSASGGNYFPPVPNANASTCLPTGTFGTSGGGDASLVWKFSKGTLTDYSISKERLGYNGIYNTAPNCTYRYASNGLHTQTYKAINIINDSIALIISSNNNVVIKLSTGKNDSTANINFPGVYEKGKYQILNTTNPVPINNSNLLGSPIPAVGAAIFTQPIYTKRASNGKIFVPIGSPVLGPYNRIMTTVDTGRTWSFFSAIPVGRNYSNYGTQSIDITPSGRIIVGGQGGVIADSIPGGAWSSNYSVVAPAGSYNQIDFVDCNNGMVAGTSSITVTTDGGKTWLDKGRPDFAASFYTIGGFSYPTLTKSYFAVSNGIVYSSIDQATTLDPAYANSNYRMGDVAAIGNDSVWAVGSANTTVVPLASRKPGIFRSFDGGNTWTEYSNFFPGSNAQTFTEVEFPSKNIGYVAGSRDTIWKTTDAGVTWTKLPVPTPGVTPQITYSDMFALDDNTVFLTGNGFPRMVIFKTTDGGNTWTDITSNALTLRPESNVNNIMFHDANNGYVTFGGSILRTTNGGTSWTLDYSISNTTGAMGFSPRKVPAGISFQNRKLFVAGGGPNIMEYGNPQNINVNSTETVTNATCTNLTGGTITVSATGGLAPYSYSADGGAFQTSNVLTGLGQGSHTITIKDAFCGTLTKTLNVGFTDNMTVAARTDTTLCAGATVQLDATAPAGSTYSWTPTTGLSVSNIKNPILTTNINTPANTNITYTVTASLNGCVKTDDVIVSIKPGPVVNAGPDVTILANNEALLQGSSSTAAQTIAWTPTNSILYGGTTFQTKVKPATTTTYTLTVISTNGCRSTDDVVVTVIPNCADVKNAFTPNGDGMNDRWIVSSSSACYTKLSVAVYNRYGGEVFRDDNYNNDWNGEYKGKPVADGTYYYVVNFKLLDGRTMTLKGDVTILR